MRLLLSNIKTALTRTLTFVRDTDVFFSLNPDIIPDGAKLPCIGIKDGKKLISELPGDTLENDLFIEIYLYDRAIPGDDNILDFLVKAEAISAAVLENDLSGYVREVSPVSESPNTLLYAKKGLLLRRGLFFEYEKLEE